jgi:putative endonuclease
MRENGVSLDETPCNHPGVNTAIGLHNQQLGFHGERVAERWLVRKGWRVIQRRFRDGHRDVDLIVEREGTVAFIEVKARSGAAFGSPVEAVDWRKRRELARSARMWISRHGHAGENYRFDVIGVLVSGAKIRVRHVENAFQVPR